MIICKTFLWIFVRVYWRFRWSCLKSFIFVSTYIRLPVFLTGKPTMDIFRKLKSVFLLERKFPGFELFYLKKNVNLMNLYWQITFFILFIFWVLAVNIHGLFTLLCLIIINSKVDQSKTHLIYFSSAKK